MRNLFCRENAVLRLIELSFALALLLWAPIAPAQRTVGDLLNFGAKRLSPEEFKEEVVQRVILGPTAGGGNLEILYAQTGVIQGRGTYSDTSTRNADISGEWTVDDTGRICTSMRIGGGPGGAIMGVMLPPRCQFWFKYGGEYFVADSDTDRYAMVIRRILKQ
jgi:hypothetical protein